MRIIRILSNENGSHDNQTYHGILPEGWALVPDNLDTENFPFGNVEVETKGKYTIVTSWNPLSVPTDEDVVYEPTQLDRIEAQITYTALMTNTLIKE